MKLKKKIDRKREEKSGLLFFLTKNVAHICNGYHFKLLQFHFSEKQQKSIKS